MTRREYREVKTDACVKIGAKSYAVFFRRHRQFYCADAAERQSCVADAVCQLQEQGLTVALLAAEPQRYGEDAVLLSREAVVMLTERVKEKKGAPRVILLDGLDRAEEMEADVCRLAALCGCGIPIFLFTEESREGSVATSKRFAPAVDILHNGFYMKDVTNFLMNGLYQRGYAPTLNLGRNRLSDTVWVSISVTVAGCPFYFRYDYDARGAEYALVLPECEEACVHLKARVLQAEDSCFSEVVPEEGRTLIGGKRGAGEITQDFLDRLLWELGNLFSHA